MRLFLSKIQHKNIPRVFKFCSAEKSSTIVQAFKMTAEDIITADKERAHTNATETASEAEVGSVEVQWPVEVAELFVFLSNNEKIVFKSQQIDDPELQRAEKVQIARRIYEKNRQTFLMRFGGYFEERHLQVFARTSICAEAVPTLRADENSEEMQFLLLEYQRKLQTRKQDVKNRRYAAMQELIGKGEYFSEQEMMKRAPELYQELIGQYLSNAEKKERDGYDLRNTTFSGILMHTMEQREMENVLKEADKQNEQKARLAGDSVTLDELEEDHNSNSSNNSTDASSHEGEQTTSSLRNKDATYYDEIPVSFRQQWGNFDNEPVACSTSVHITKSIAELKSEPHSQATYIAAGERDLLRQEFLGIMHEKFLSGQDEDFDYSQVDDNSQLDDLRQLNQDKEDAYFEESDEEGEETEQMQEDSDDSEDELDIYMSHLSRHHSLQK